MTNGETNFTCAGLSDEMVNRDIGMEPTRLSDAKIRSMLRTLNKSDVVKVAKSRTAESAWSVTLHPRLVRWAEVVDFPLSARLAQWAKVVKFDLSVLQQSALILADSDADLKILSADIHRAEHLDGSWASLINGRIRARDCSYFGLGHHTALEFITLGLLQPTPKELAVRSLQRLWFTAECTDLLEHAEATELFRDNGTLSRFLSSCITDGQQYPCYNRFGQRYIMPQTLHIHVTDEWIRGAASQPYKEASPDTLQALPFHLCTLMTSFDCSA